MKLADWMEDHEKTAAEVGRMCGVHRSAISRLLTGQRSPTFDLALRIWEATGRKVGLEAWRDSHRDLSNSSEGNR